VCGVVFDIKMVLELPVTKDSNSILKDLISMNSASVLTKIDLAAVLRKMSIIRDGKA
jgi:hypothetical protein